MCLGSAFTPEHPHKQQLYELHGFRRVGIYAIFQIILMIIGIIIIALGQQIFGTNWIYNVIIGAIIIVIFSILPNGKPFFLNLYRMGREYVMFDGNNREIVLVTTHCANVIKPSIKIICSYSQFRGIAVHHKSKKILLLCRREESLLLKSIGECLPDNKQSIETILEEISLFWFQRNQNDAFFGITYIDFKDGLVAEGNVNISIDYDYYLKRSDTWKPKNNMYGAGGARNNAPKEKKKNNKIMDARSPEDLYDENDGLDRDQYLDVHKEKKKGRFESVSGAEVDVGSDDDIVVDYV